MASDSNSKLPSVAYLGPRTSYSHQAATECFDPATHTFSPQITIEDIFHSVEDNLTTYGVIPFENSTNGHVLQTLSLLSASNFPRTRIISETYLDVHHCLLTLAPSLSSITRLYSHPQAFGQCERYLNTHLKGVERVDVSSTSKAAQLAAQDAGAAAIASRVAADVNGLAVLAGDIEDSRDNTTRFFVISASASADGERGKEKTLLRFMVDHEMPGALCDALRVFKDNGLNLTSIVSRPSRVVKWNYIFFVEFEGHEEDDGVKRALAELERYCRGVRVLGSYRDRMNGKGKGEGGGMV